MLLHSVLLLLCQGSDATTPLVCMGSKSLSHQTWYYSGTPFLRPPPLERPLDNVYLNMNVLISTPDERPPLLKGHFSDAKGVALQGVPLYCVSYFNIDLSKSNMKELIK